MLEPDTRHLLLEALRPPPHHRLDIAVGTTYSLDLPALMAAPVAFAMFDRQRGDGTLVEDPIATLQALREHAARITLFCQAGQIAVPPAFRSLLVYLEDSVYPVVPPKPEAIFHPKVWYLRYRDDGGNRIAYRLLCLSRNLTFDRSWDTVLRLDGVEGDTIVSSELARFADALVTMVARNRPLPVERVAAIRELGDQFGRAVWTLPAGFDRMRFWPLGIDESSDWPFEGRRDRTLVISPFVGEGALARLTKGFRGSILLSRPESFDQLGGKATKHLAERLVLSADASAVDRDETEATVWEATAEAADRRLDGLHAKVYVADAGWRARVWTGSANATDAAFHGNVEFLVEFEGSKDRCGVEATIGAHKDRVGLRKLVEAYDPPNDAPLEPTAADDVERRLDRARRAIGGFRFTAVCAALPDDRWRVVLTGKPVVETGAAMDGIEMSIRPVTLGPGLADPILSGVTGFRVGFDLSEPAVTPYFAVSLAIGDASVEFVIAAELIDPPVGRAERVLTGLLSNRADLIRFLLLLLGSTEEALAAFEGDGTVEAGSGVWLAGRGSEALLEPLVRTFARDPARLRDIERLVHDLRRGDDGTEILPERWHEVWGPIAAALNEDGAR